MKPTFTSIFLLVVFYSVYAQPQINSFDVNGHSGTGVESVTPCDSNYANADIDTGTSTQSQWYFRISAVDSLFARKAMDFYSSGANGGKWVSGAFQEEQLIEVLDSFLVNYVGFFTVTLYVGDSSASAPADTVSLQFASKKLPELYDGTLEALDPHYFGMPKYEPFDTSFPGSWVNPSDPSISVYATNPWHDYFRFELTELDSLGNPIRQVQNQYSTNTVPHISVRHRGYGVPIVAVISSSQDKWFHNTGREYYRFSMIVGVAGCEEDSVYGYLRVYSPGEIGMSEQGSPGTVEVYPNPVGNTLTISDPEGLESVSIYDLVGKPVFSREMSGYETGAEIDVSRWPGGSYILKGTNGRGDRFSEIITIR